VGAACPADSRPNQDRQRATDDNAGGWFDSDCDCHSLCGPHADGSARNTKSLETYEGIAIPKLAPFGGALVACHKCVSSERVQLVSWNFANRDMEKQSSVIALCFNQHTRRSVPASSSFTRVMNRKRCRMRFIPRVIKESRAINSKMPRLLTATAFIALFCCTVALAESDTPHRQRTIRSSPNLPKTTVGQRQPTPPDGSATKGNDDNGLLGDDAVDKALDSKIRSICRGCF
jgi:hypothetical protein